jgi:hypothetical protein
MSPDDDVRLRHMLDAIEAARRHAIEPTREATVIHRGVKPANIIARDLGRHGRASRSEGAGSPRRWPQVLHVSCALPHEVWRGDAPAAGYEG